MENSKSEAHFYNFTHEKAGMQNLDRQKINQVIHEASKDSEYYKREQDRSKQIESRVESMKQRISEVVEDPSSVSHLNSTLNTLLEEIESLRVLSETWIHIDMDMFYASVEIRDNPSLSDKPIAVGSNSMIATANYVARQYGVRSAMPGFIGKLLCKDLIFIKPNFSKYRTEGEKIRKIFREFDPDFESLGLDEGHLHVTNILKKLDLDNDEGRQKLAETIRTRIFEETQLTASAGIACNKMLAKIATDLGKPNGQYYIRNNRADILHFMENLNIRKIPGIGKAMEKVLNELGIFICGDILKKKLELLIVYSESSFDFLIRAALGIGHVSHSDLREDKKSISVSSTFRDTDDIEKLKKMLQEFCGEISRELLDLKAFAKCVSINLKNYKFQTKVRSETVNKYINKESEIFEVALRLLLAEGVEEKVRLIGVRVSNLIYDKGTFIDEFLEKGQRFSEGVKCPVCSKTFYYQKLRMEIHIKECSEKGPGFQRKLVKKRGKGIPNQSTLDGFFIKK